MLTPKEVENLAELSRLSLSTEEKENIAKDLESILGYVSELSEAKDLEAEPPSADAISAETALVRNVMREDADPHQSGEHTESILNESPNREGDYIKVKQILGGSDVA